MKSLEELVEENRYIHYAAEIRSLKERQEKQRIWGRVILWSGFVIVWALIVLMFWLPVLVSDS